MMFFYSILFVIEHSKREFLVWLCSKAFFVK